MQGWGLHTGTHMGTYVHTYVTLTARAQILPPPPHAHACTALHTRMLHAHTSQTKAELWGPPPSSPGTPM